MRSILTLCSLLLLTHAASSQTTADSAPEAAAAYGAAVAVSEQAVFVGEPGTAYRPGTVYVYEHDADSGPIALTSSEPFIGDRFGSLVAVDASTLLVSAPAADSSRGAVYVFTRGDDGIWAETGAWKAPSGSDGFGGSLYLNETIAVVGAPQSRDRAGLAYVYERTSAGWMQTATLAARDVVEDDLFGASVTIAQGRVLVGAPGRRSRAGDVYVFGLEGATWTEKGTLDRRVEAGDRFGSSLGASGDRVVVGAPRYGGVVGAAFSYVWDDAWEAEAVLTPFVSERDARFATSVAVLDNEVWVGAPGMDRFAGAFLVYSVEGGVWTRALKQQPPNPARGQRFGSTVAATGNRVIAGLPGAHSGTGSAVIYLAGDTGWSLRQELSGPVDAFDALTGTETPCVDGEAGEFSCSGVDLLSFKPVSEIGGRRGIQVNDIWGWVDPSNGREYALVGRTDGVSFIDVTDHLNPVYVGNLPKTDSSPVSIWRDIKVYRDVAYVVADGAGNHGMQVFDLTRLRSFDGTPIEFTEDARYDQIHSAHNIVINEDSGFGYAVGSSSGGETCGGGLHMIDLRNPLQPSFAGCFADPATGRSGTGYTHDAQCVIYRGPDTAHVGREICFNANETALSIADVTDKDSTIAVSSAGYPSVGYSHQGWLTEDHAYFYLNDELDELNGGTDGTRTLIWDVSDLEDPQLVKEHISDVKSSDHNLYIRGNLMYQSNYVAGLRILDITDRANPVEVAFFDTVPQGDNSPGFEGSWSNYPFFPSGSIVVTSGREGVFVLKKSNIDL